MRGYLNDLEPHLLHLSAKIFSVLEFFQCFRITPNNKELVMKWRIKIWVARN